ncbi:MAG: shikimate kinase [Armatimonadetes bacterium]|nr:shikimate kinase [Armatimonadota bacterium]
MKLAGSLDVPFLDTDVLLERRLGRPIRQWFQIYGETAFREHEHLVLAEMTEEEGVLATGGGIVLREDNWAEMHRLGVVVFLDVLPEVLKERLRTTKRKRPLLEHADWEERFDSLLTQRRDLYLRADFVVPSGAEDHDVVASRIKEMLLGE